LFVDIFYDEHPEKDGWWSTELESLGIHSKKDNSNELNDKQNKINLVECIKQRFIAKYEQVYYTSNKKNIELKV
jgi:hypothetical protein